METTSEAKKQIGVGLGNFVERSRNRGLRSTKRKSWGLIKARVRHAHSFHHPLSALPFFLDAQSYWMRPSLLFLAARPLVRTTVPARQCGPRQHFSTAPRLAIDARRVAGQIEIKTIDDKIAEFPVNEKISALEVKLKNAEGKLSEPTSLYRLLSSIDRSSQYVLQISNAVDGQIPIVQIVTRADLVKRINRQEDQLRHHKRTAKASKPKQLELNWAISTNDLQLKMKQMQDFLAKGKKVEILFANKRHQRKASPEEAEALLKMVREKIDEVGATEAAEMEGAILRQALLSVKMREKQ